MRRTALRAGVAVGLGVALVGSFLGWFRSGSAVRSSFETLGLAQRLGVLGAPWDRLAPVWLALPAMSAVVSVALIAGRDRWVGGAAVAGGTVGLVGATVAIRAPHPTTVGMVLTLLGAAVTAACGLLLVVVGRDGR